jgi:uncharacterized membrane protein YgcG
MARKLIGELIVRLVDNVSAEAKKVAASLKEVDRTAIGTGKSARGADSLATALKHAADNARLLASEGRGLEGWGQRFDRMLGRLKLGARDIDQVRSSWQRLQSQLKAGTFDEAFRTNAVQHWRNETIAALTAVNAQASKTKHELSGLGVGRTMGRIVKNTGIVAGIGGGVYGAGYVARRGIKSAAELPREQTRQWLAGMTAQEQAIAAVKARELSAKYPSLGQLDVMEHIRQLRARFGDFHHAMENVETLVKAQVVLGNLGKGSEHAGHDLERLVLGLETIVGGDPVKFTTLVNAFLKAKQLFPDLQGEDFRQYLQTSKASKYGLSEGYLATVAPTMMQHEGAAKFGTMQATAFGSLVGLRSLPRSVDQMVKFGLAEKVHWEGRKRYLDKIKEEDLLISNPFLWARDVMQPALAAQGVKIGPDATEKEREEFVSVVQKMFGNRNAAEFFTSLLVNQQVIAKDLAMLNRTKGLEVAEGLREKDPFIAAHGVMEQLINVVQNALEPYSERAAAALNTVADALARIAAKVKESKVFGEVTAPAGVAVAGGATAAVGAGATALGATTLGGVMSVLGGAAGVLGWHAAGAALREELIQQAKDDAKKGKGPLASKLYQYPQTDFTFGKSSQSFRNAGTLPSPSPFMRNREAMKFEVVPSKPGGTLPLDLLSPDLPSRIHARIEELKTITGVPLPSPQIAAPLQVESDKALGVVEQFIRRLKSLMNFTAAPQIPPGVGGDGALQRASYSPSDGAGGLGGGGGRFGGIPRAAASVDAASGGGASSSGGGGSGGPRVASLPPAGGPAALPSLGGLMRNAANRGRANFMHGQYGGPGQNLVTVSTAGGRRLTVNRESAPAIQGFLNELESQGAPITSVGSYAHRNIAGSGRWSQHAFGNAIDINQAARNVVGRGFRTWANSNAGALRDAERRWGMTSGGDWRDPDFGHWEWSGKKPWLDRAGEPGAGGGAAEALRNLSHGVKPFEKLPVEGERGQGGSVSAGDIYRVNEFRQEYFSPESDGVVLPTLPAGAGGGGRGDFHMNGSTTINNHMHGINDVGALAQQVSAQLNERIESGLRGAFADYGVEV